MKLNFRACILGAATAAAITLTTSSASANDWYRWRGPEQDGISRETNLPETWSPPAADGTGAENVAWAAPYGGMSSPIVMKGKLYTISRIGEVPAGDTVNPGPKTQETVVCLDAKTGKKIWEHGANMYQTDDPFHRIGWSNVCGDPATGRVYALGAQNELVCLDGENGKIVWKHQMTEEYGLISTFGGRTPSPAIDEDHLFLVGVAFGWGDNAGAAYRAFCFDKNTGQPVWTNLTGGIPTDAPYQTPVIANINGEHVLVSGTGDGGVYCFQARTGKKLWGYKASKRGFNSAVIVHDNKVYANWDLDNFDSVRLGGIVCLDPSVVKDGEPKIVWHIEGFEAGFPSATITPDGKTLFVPDDKAIIYAIDTATGTVKYRSKGLGTIGKASLVWADGKLYFPEANGRMCILKPGEKKFEVLSKVDVIGKKGREYDLFGSVAISDGHVYLQAANEMYCIGPKDFAAQKAEVPAGPAEEAAVEAKPSKAAIIQVVPCDISLKPGEKVKFVATAFDAKGRQVGAGHELKAEWKIDKVTLPAPRARPKELVRPPAAVGPNGTPATAPAVVKPVAPPATQPAAPIKAGNLKGAVDASGEFTAAGGPLQGGAVVAEADGLSGFARVRVFPPLPWKADFEKDLVGKPPLTWIGAGMKFAVHELPENGKPNNVLTKLTDIPLFARARTYFGTADMANYTLEGDVMVDETVVKGEDGKIVHVIPDVGIINSRYVLELKGVNQWVGLHAWGAALPRVETEDSSLAPHEAVNFPWKAKTWYHLKLQVTQQTGSALCQGKVWPTGQAEPREWMLTLKDETPNVSGSPGLWGFSNSHEIYYDNLVVTPNSTVAIKK